MQRRPPAALKGTASVIALCVIGIGAANGASNPSPDSADAVERGHYIAIAGSCVGCHQRDGGEAYAGGLAIASPFGNIHSRNITPDVETGIGSWTEEDFKRSLYEGYSKDVGYIYPAMPYTNYTKMTEQDVSDLWAYMQSLKPVSYSPPENDMTFPTNLRQGIAAWQAVELDQERWQPTEGRGDEYNRGAYLVEALGHCTQCHSPRNLAFGIDSDREYTGAEIHGWYAPGIGAGPLSEISDWSIDELATFLRTGQGVNNEKVIGEMTRVVHDSLSRMTPEDVRAIATYVKEMPPPADTSPIAEQVSIEPARLQSGAELYAENCESCHQKDGIGIEGGAPSLVGNAAAAGRVGNNIVMMMLEGHAPDGTWGVMPSFAQELDDGQMADIANYVRTSWGNEAQPNVEPEKIGSLREVAEYPPGGQQAAVDCAVISADRIQPALDVPWERYAAAENDPSVVRKMVESYRGERANSSAEDIVQAFSTVYCRSMAESEKLTSAEQQSRVATFTAQVAEAAEATGGADGGANGGATGAEKDD